MFMYELHDSHEGVRLIAAGELWSQIIKSVHRVAEASPLIVDDEPFRGLAGMARKSQKNSLEVDEVGVRNYADFDWPTLLIQTSLLRQSLAYVVHDEADQAVTYALEAVIKQALQEDFELKAQGIIHAWRTVDASRFTAQRNIDEVITSYFGWTAEQRSENLDSLIGMPGWMEVSKTCGK